MARKKRHILAGFCYHVMLRGIGGQDIYRDKEDYTRFCLLLQYASEKHGLNVLAFCLMGNHFHLIIQPQGTDLAAGMHALAFRYAQYFNKKYNRRGYLYQGRYKAILVQTGTYLRRLVRYVHLNPVRAGIVNGPEGYIWSSCRAYIGHEAYTWLNMSIVLDAFGVAPGAQKRLIDYTLMDDEETRSELFDIRKSLQTGAYGDPEFLEKWHPKLSKEVFAAQNNSALSLEAVVEVVCSHFHLSLEDLRSDKRESHLVLARTLLACLIQELKLASMTALGDHILRDPTSLAKLVRKAHVDPKIQTKKEEIMSQFISSKERVEGDAERAVLSAAMKSYA